MKRLLDIIICTYQREDLLLDCITALDLQHTSTDQWGVIVVNNALDSLSISTLSVMEDKDFITVVNEPNIGLSKARNTGIATSRAEWLAFLDDDARATSDYVKNILNIIDEESWHCFGGHIQSWWKYGRPRWLDDDYGSKPIMSSSRVILDQQYNWGSNIIIKKSCLLAVEGFPSDVGMRGNQLGYSAENIVQDHLRQHGYIIGYDPQLRIDHVVMRSKLRLKWHLRSAYATGRDGKDIFEDQYRLKGLIKSCKNCISRPLKSISFLLLQKNYFWEHALLDALQPYFLLAGKIRSLLILRS